MTNQCKETVKTDSADTTASVDSLLVERALRGGPDAFRQIVDRFQGAVFAVALSRVRDFHLAEDVAQLVFTEAYQKLASLKDPAKLGAWLRSVAVRRSLNAIRSRREEVAIREDGSDNLLIGDANEDLEREDLRRRVGKAIGSLGEALRETTILFYMDGYSIVEIASMMSVPTGTVKRRLHDARAKLKSEMLDLISDTLKSEKPDDDFGDQVYTMIRQYATDPGGWWSLEKHDRIVDLGVDGVEGLRKALTSPHGMTRRFAVQVINAFHRKAAKDDRREVLVELMKGCLTDPSKVVRFSAVKGLFFLDVSKERKQREFVPLVVDMLEDRSGTVRRKVAYMLLWHSDYVPLERASLALANVGSDDWTRKILSRLVRKIVERKG